MPLQERRRVGQACRVKENRQPYPGFARGNGAVEIAEGQAHDTGDACILHRTADGNVATAAGVTAPTVRLARYTELAVAVGGAGYALYALMHPYQALLQQQR